MPDPRVRPPAVAGSFYPQDPASLRSAIENSFLGKRGPGTVPRAGGHTGMDRRVIAGVVPHAGYVYSGPVAAHFYGRVSKERPPKTILLLGVNHHGVGGLFSLSDEDWRTPLGTVPTDRELLAALARPPLTIDGPAHHLEHSIEVEIPFLQYLWPESLSIVALQVSFSELSLLKEVGRIVAEAVASKDVLLIASTDFSHYLPPEEAHTLDGKAHDALLTLSPDRLYRTVVTQNISMCGIAPTTVLLAALEDSHVNARLLARGTSGDAEPMETVVGYASFSLER